MAFAYSPKIVTDGLVFAVDAANTKSYPGSGTTWKDLSGNSNDGTLTNGPTFDSANGGSIVFDGSDDYVEFFYSGDLTTESFTFSFFAKSDVTGGNRYTFMGLSNGGDYAFKTYNMQIWSGEKQFLSFVGTNSSYSSYSFNINGDFRDWNFYCTVITPTYIKTWVNDDLMYDSNVALRGSFDRFWIGQRLGQHFNGKIPNFLIHNKALTDQEVLQNYNALKGRFNL